MEKIRLQSIQMKLVRYENRMCFSGKQTVIFNLYNPISFEFSLLNFFLSQNQIDEEHPLVKNAVFAEQPDIVGEVPKLKVCSIIKTSPLFPYK